MGAPVNDNENGDKGPALGPGTLPPGVFQWVLTFAPQTGAMKIEGPAHPPLIIEALARAIVVMSGNVAPKEEPKIVPAAAGLLHALGNPRGRTQ